MTCLGAIGLVKEKKTSTKHCNDQRSSLSFQQKKPDWAMEKDGAKAKAGVAGTERQDSSSGGAEEDAAAPSAAAAAAEEHADVQQAS